MINNQNVYYPSFVVGWVRLRETKVAVGYKLQYNVCQKSSFMLENIYHPFIYSTKQNVTWTLYYYDWCAHSQHLPRLPSAFQRGRVVLTTHVRSTPEFKSDVPVKDRNGFQMKYKRKILEIVTNFKYLGVTVKQQRLLCYYV